MLQSQAMETARLRRTIAGRGNDTTRVRYRNDGYPAGLICWAGHSRIDAGAHYGIRLARRDYATGEVSVLVSFTAGAGVERGTRPLCAPVTVAWANGEYGEKLVAIDTATLAGAMAVSVSIGSPTGGAVIAGDATHRFIRFADEDGHRAGSVVAVGRMFAAVIGLLGLARREVRR